MTIPVSRCPSPCIAVSPARSWSTRSTKPAVSTAFPRRCSPTTPWSTPPASQAGRAAATPSKPASLTSASNRNTLHPTTCGKVERFQQTLKKYLTAQPTANNLDELQALIDEFTGTYNNYRPHRSLNRATPAAVYNRLPKTGPQHNGADTHFRVRHDRIDKTGTVTIRHNSRLHHIGIGRAHKHTPVTLLVADLDIRVITTQTGQLLRRLTLDPARDYQPQTNPQ